MRNSGHIYLKISTLYKLYNKSITRNQPNQTTGSFVEYNRQFIINNNASSVGETKQ